MKPWLYRLGILTLLGVLAACGQPAPPGMKIGKPYVIDGKTYYPEYDPTYDKIGEASWYGPGFHGKYTANGEVFDQNDLTAAHPTLPMPSLVRVTNLKTGKSIIVRVNDRGPFKNNRIIDLSKKSAKELGVTSIAKVRVQFLQSETQEYLASLQGARHIDVASLTARENAAKNNYVTRSTEPDSAEIVESTVAENHMGQAVDDAAPVLAVDSQELARPQAKALKTAKNDEPKPVKLKGMGLVKEAMADDAIPPAKLASASRGGSGYFVQAGSFASERNAQKLHAQLGNLERVAIDKIDMNNRAWWRVRLGPFEDKADADEQLSKVRAAGVSDARIMYE